MTECESCDNQHVTSMGQRENLESFAGIKPEGTPEHFVGATPEGRGVLNKVKYREALPRGPTP